MTRGLVLAAPASGSGKTAVTLALLRALRRSGVDVAGMKAGPDYIDPGFHAAATGRPSINLDPWAMRLDTIAGLVASTAAEIVLCEGVMGLFDGAGAAGDKGSTADLAALTGWPVILIVDAGRQSASVAALVRGFAIHRADVPLAGIILNKVGSARHANMLRAALAASLPDLPILGIVPRSPALHLPERHLGLVLAAEHVELDAFLERAADHAAAAVDLKALCDIARPAGLVGAAPSLPPLGRRTALARDTAFAFAYPHLLNTWVSGGAEILPFSPLADEVPDLSADAIFLPGGYPELHGARLAAATRFRQGMRAAADRGILIYGECGGYMVLGQALIDGQGQRHPMLGLLPVVTSMETPRRHLGYRQAVGQHGPWRGQNWRGHEFHYTSIVEAGDAPPLWRLADADGLDLGTAGHVAGSVSGSFLHLVDAAL